MMYLYRSNIMNFITSPEIDPIERLLERNPATFDDKEKNNKKPHEAQETQDTTPEQAQLQDETRETLNQVREQTQTQQEIKEELSIFWLITKTELLINKYKDLKRHAKKYSRNKEDKWYEQAFKWQTENRLRRLENIKRFLNKYDKKSWWLDGASLNRYNREINNIDKEVASFEQWRDEIVMEKTWSQTPYIIDIHTFKDTKEIIKANEEINRMLKKLDLLELDAALKTELKEELESLQKYLEASINWKIDAGTQPFKFKHYEDFKQLGIIDTKAYPIFDDQKYYKKDNKSTNYKQTDYGVDKNWRKTDCLPVKSYSNLDEAWKKWWLLWMMDYGFSKTNMNPQQRQFWNKAGNLAMIWGWIWLGRKALSSILWFDKNKWKDRWKWIWWIVGGTLLLQWATGKNPLQTLKEVFNWWDAPQRISEIFGWKTEWWKISSETTPEEIAYIHGFTWLPAIFGGMRIEQIKWIVKQEWWHTKISDYNTLAAVLRSTKNIDAQKWATMVETLAQDNDKYNIVWLTLDAMWLDRETIQKWWDKKFEEYNIDAIKNLWALNSYMENKWYNWININKPWIREWIREFIAKGIPSLEDLRKAWAFKKETQTAPQQTEIKKSDWRINQFDIKDDKLWLKETIDKFKLTELQKKNLIAAGNILSQDTGNKQIEFKEVQDKIYLKTYNERTPIDITNKIIVDLKNGKENIYFAWLWELVNAANLTNYIKHLFRWKHSWNVPANWEYFARSTLLHNIKTLTPLNWLWDLVYTMRQWDKSKKRRDPRSYWRTMDTEVIDAWWLGYLKEKSPTLNSNVSAYADYLNKIDIRHMGTKDRNLPN